MKRFAFVVVLVVGLALITSVNIAYAGIWNKFTDVAMDKVLEVVLSGAFFLLTYFLGRKVNKWRKVANEGKDFALWVYKSTRKDSPGGAKITGKELDEGLKEFGELGVAILEATKRGDDRLSTG